MSGRRRIKIAAAQYQPDLLRDLAAARDKLARWVADAAGHGAELLVFPEYGAMELAAASGERIAADLAASLDAVASAMGEIDAAHAELARQHDVHILAASGPARQADGEAFVNRARLVTPSGRVGAQDKLIMTPFEHDWGVAGGKTLQVFDTALGRLGIAICYDSEFPLLVRAQAEAGAELIIVPSCTERVTGAHRVRSAALARALENTCAAVVAPLVGDAPWCPAIDRNTGVAGIYTPAEAGLSDTGVVAEGRLGEPGWVYADIDLDALQRLHDTGEMRNRADWALQPGAAPQAQHAHLISLLD